MNDLGTGLLVLAAAVVLFSIAMAVVRALSEFAKNNKFLVYVSLPCGFVGLKAVMALASNSWQEYGEFVTQGSLLVIAGFGILLGLVGVVLKFRKN